MPPYMLTRGPGYPVLASACEYTARQAPANPPPAWLREYTQTHSPNGASCP
jgi:hypothetical protein